MNGEADHVCEQVYCHTCEARDYAHPAPSPAAEPPEGLREAVARWLYDLYHAPATPWEDAPPHIKETYRRYVDSGPLAAVLRQAEADRAAVERVEALADDLEAEAEETLAKHTPGQIMLGAPILQAERATAQSLPRIAERIRDAVDGTP